MPAQEARAGIPVANGVFGVLLWGAGRTLHLTLGRADYASPEEPAEEPLRLPVGRLDLELPIDCAVISGGLYLLTGEAELEVDGNRQRAKVRASVVREAPVLCLRMTGIDGGGVRVVSRPPDLPETLEWFRKLGMPKAQTFDLDEFGGWVQERAAAPALCVGWLRQPFATGLVLYATSVYGDTPQEARRSALQALESVRRAGYTPATLRGFSWWRRWWEEAAGPSAERPGDLFRQLDRYRVGLLEPAPLSPARVIPPPADPVAGGSRGEAPQAGVDDRGEVRIASGGRWLAAGPLRPPFLDGTAIGGHRPPSRAYRP